MIQSLLHQTTRPQGMISLCSKGTSSVPVPRAFDWLQLQKDFDKFANGIRTKLFFSNSTVNNIIPNKQCAPRKPSKWKAPKSSIPEVETYLSSIERDLFCESIYISERYHN